MNSNDDFGYRGDRVREHTAPEVNRSIDDLMRQNIRVYSAADPSAIDERIRELEQEWDIERVLELNACAVSLIGLLLGARVDKRWLALPALVAAFFAQHAIQGGCPPLAILRRFGLRTQREIEAEKYALKSLQKTEMEQTSASSVYLAVGLQ